MVIGHFAAGFALKKAAPGIPLALLLLGVILPDIMLGIFLLTGVEHARIIPGTAIAYPVDFYDIPLTHSLTGAAGWSMLGIAAFWLWPGRERDGRLHNAGIFGLTVFSHYLLDLTTHARLPLWGADSFVPGLFLYRSAWATFVIESILLAAGLAVYRGAWPGSTRSSDQRLALQIGLLMALYIWSLLDLEMNYLLPDLPALLGMNIFLTAGLTAIVALGWWVEKGGSGAGTGGAR